MYVCMYVDTDTDVVLNLGAPCMPIVQVLLATSCLDYNNSLYSVCSVCWRLTLSKKALAAQEMQTDAKKKIKPTGTR